MTGFWIRLCRACFSEIERRRRIHQIQHFVSFKNCWHYLSYRPNRQVAVVTIWVGLSSMEHRWNLFLQKQPFDVFFNKKNRKTTAPESVFNEVAGLQLIAILRKRLWRRYFPVNFARFLKATFRQLLPFLKCEGWSWKILGMILIYLNNLHLMLMRMILQFSIFFHR